MINVDFCVDRMEFVVQKYESLLKSFPFARRK